MQTLLQREVKRTWRMKPTLSGSQEWCSRWRWMECEVWRWLEAQGERGLERTGAEARKGEPFFR